MIIDVSERVDNAKRLTAEWATAAGYKQPDDDTGDLSKIAHDLQRIMNVSEFGCRQKNVHSILQVLIGEKFPIDQRALGADYAQRVPFAVGSVLTPLRRGYDRPGIVVRVSKSGSVGLKLSNSESHGKHWHLNEVRPATDAEIDRYFEEVFGLAVNPADNPPPEEQEPFTVDGGGIPF